MTDRTHVTVHVELDPQDGSIAGRLLDDGGASRGFAGWIGLAASIENALADVSQASTSYSPYEYKRKRAEG